MTGIAKTVAGVLRGDPDAFERRGAPWVLRVGVAVSAILANTIGAVIVVTLLIVVLPLPDEVDGDAALRLRNGVVAGVYVLAAVTIGVLRGLVLGKPVTGFLASDRDPTDDARRNVLRFPLRLGYGQAALWGVAVVLFTMLNVFRNGLLAFEIGITVALGGAATATISYLLVTRLSRGAAARVLADAPPRSREAPGVTTRLLAIWVATSAVPIAGAMMVAVFALIVDIQVDALARATIALCAIMLGFGLQGMVLLARSFGDPLRRLRDGLQQVESGDLDVALPVHDTTEIGYATAGLNRLVEDLKERERLRDLFGRQVGEDVARRALEEGVTLGGEERRAAALFVDIVGSTGFAADRGPTETVEALNAFFKVVVETTGDHGGMVNKFAGDAALCVFGAPLDQDDPATSSLACARAMQARLREDVDAIAAGIGVAIGTVVAGNVGTAERYEYTVIGDAVNVAARLTDLAKDRDGGVLVAADVVDAAGDDERARWRIGEAEQVRGREEPLRVAELADTDGPPPREAASGAAAGPD